MYLAQGLLSFFSPEIKKARDDCISPSKPCPALHRIQFLTPCVHIEVTLFHTREGFGGAMSKRASFDVTDLSAANIHILFIIGYTPSIILIVSSSGGLKVNASD